MSTRPTPEQDDLRRHAEWAGANYKTIATVAAVADDLRAHAKIVRDAGGDSKGRRVAELRRLHHRLDQVYAELENLPEPLLPFLGDGRA